MTGLRSIAISLNLKCFLLLLGYFFFLFLCSCTPYSILWPGGVFLPRKQTSHRISWNADFPPSLLGMCF